MSTEFRWNHNDFQMMYESCKEDDAVSITIKHIKSKKAIVLEAGSGSGRVVKYLYDLGYTNVHGIELNDEAVKNFNKKFPKINVIQGDILKMPYKREMFDLIASYGVVEHFIPGLNEPLKAFKRVLKKDGLLIVSVPSHNILRQLIFSFDIFFDRLKFWSKSRRNIGRYYIHPQFGDFFEYRLKPSEFLSAAKLAGFEILDDIPIYHLDGLYHIFGNSLIKYQNYRFYPTKLGFLVNDLMKRVPFLHNHMQLLVLKKKS